MLRTINDYSIGADEVLVLPTWIGPEVPRNMLLVLRAARVIATSSRDTVIHIHLSTGGAYLREGPLLLLARLMRRKAIVSLHGNDFPEFATRHPRFVGTILRRARRITCLSDEAEQAAGQLVGSDRVVQVPNPVAIDLEAPPVGQAPPVALFAGIVGLRKGADVLIEAWRLLKSRGVVGRLRIIGPPGDFAPPALDGVSVEGAVDPTEMRSLIRQVRVVTLPSRSEGMPVVLAEALAAGRPFVATPVGGTAQLAPSSQSLVPVEDPEALAAALQLYLEDARTAEEVGERGREFCAATRSPEVIDRALRDIYASA